MNACQRRRRERDGLIVTGPPAGIGGYRFGPRALETVVSEVDVAATIAALPDALLGERPAGSAAAAIEAELRARDEHAHCWRFSRPRQEQCRVILRCR